MKLFSKDDEAYLAWLTDNPAGYVINVRVVHDTEYVVLHSAKCSLISRTSNPPGAFTGRGYRKVCVPRAGDLADAAIRLGRPDGSFSKHCQICQPST